MISPGGLIATLFSKAAVQVSEAVDAAFNYVSLLVNGGSVKPYASDAGPNNMLITQNGLARNDNFSPFAGDGYYSTYFNGSTDYLTATVAAPRTGNWTIECFVQFSTIKNAGIFQMNTTAFGGVAGFGVGVGSDSTYMVYYAGTQVGAIASVGSANQWHHIAACKSNNNTIKLFIDGIQVWSVTDTYDYSGTTMAVGGIYSTGYLLNGYVSNFRYLSGTALYTANFAPPTTALTAITGTSLLTCQSARFVDKSTNALTITATGTPKISYNNPIYSAGQLKSVKFNGSTDYVSFADNAALQFPGDFTFEFWWNSANVTPTQEIVAKGNGIQFVISGGACGIYLSADNTTTYFASGVIGSVTVGAWNHIALVRNGNTYTGYLNGTGTALGTSASAPNTGTSPLTIGSSAGLYYANGSASNLRVAKGTAIYTGNFTPSTAPLTAVSGTQLLTCQGSIVDASSNAFAATITGAPSASYTSPFAYTAAALPSTYGSAYFAGTPGGTDYLKAASSPAFALAGNPFTFECWVYFTAFPSGVNSSVFGFPTQNFTLLITPTGQLYSIGGGTNFTTAAGTVKLNQWTHIAYVKESTAASKTFIYVNGVLASGGTGTSGTTFTATADTFILGGSGGSGFGGQWGITGYVSNARLVVGTALYPSGTTFTPSTTPLTAVSGTVLLTAQTTVPAANSGIVDTSATDAVITATGTPTQGTFSPFSNGGWSTYFNGTTDYLTLPASSQYNLTGDFTVETWVYLNTLLPGNDDGWGGPTILSMSNGGNASTISADLMISLPRPAQGATPTTWLFSGVGGAQGLGAVQITGGTPVANTWTHVALTRSGTTVRAFVNGTQIGTATSSATFGSSTHVMSIGAFNYTYLRTLNGYVSNTRVVNGTALYTAAFTPSTTPLTAIANTALLTCQSNRIKDNSTNAFAITVTGTPSIQATSPFEPAAPWSAATNGGSMYFNGTTDYLSVPNSAGLNFGTDNFTIEYWFNPANVTGTKTMVAKFGTGANFGGFAMDLVDASPRILLSSTGTSWDIVNITIAGTVTANSWNHLALVRNGNTFTAYLNGVSYAVATSSAAVLTTTGNVSVGVATAALTIQYFNGHISNLRVVTGTAVYTKPFTPPTAPATPIANTTLLLSGTNAGVIDTAGKNVLATMSTASATSGTSYAAATMASGYSASFASGQVVNFTTTSAPLSQTKFTVEFWYRPTTAPNDYCIYGNSSVLFAFNSTTRWQFVQQGGAQTVTATKMPTVNAWNHIAVVREDLGNTGLKMYLNGNLVAVGGFPTLFTTASDAWTIWLSNGAGQLSNFRIVNGTAVYTAPFFVPKPQLTAIEGTEVLLFTNGTITQDVGPHGYAVTTSGTTLSTAIYPTSYYAPVTSKYGTNMMYFNGTSDYLTAPASPQYTFGTGDFTVEAWVNLTNVATNAYIASMNYEGSGGTGQWALYMTGAGATKQLWFNSSIGNNMASTTFNLPVDTWTHIAYTRSGTSGRFFVNGTQVGTTLTDSKNYPTATGTFYVGRMATAAGYFPGYIDDLRVTKGVARYVANFTAPTAALAVN